MNESIACTLYIIITIFSYIIIYRAIFATRKDSTSYKIGNKLGKKLRRWYDD